MSTHLCMCNHEHSDHNIHDPQGDTFCDKCKCQMYNAYSVEKIFRMLNHMEKLMTNVDIDRMEWQGHLDMAKMAGDEMFFELWTDDDPPKKVTPANVEETLIDKKPVRVMHRVNGQWDQIGTAEIDPRTGALSARIDKPIPEITAGVLRDFTIDTGGSLKFAPSYRKLVETPGSGVVEVPRVAIPDPDNQVYRDIRDRLDLENHPFFKGDTE